jgi:hypothetical protein
MSTSASARLVSAALALALTAFAARPAAAQQLVDSTFVPQVARPAFGSTHPVLLFDEGHGNPLTLADRFRPFQQLLEADGYRVVRSPQRFSTALLKLANVLVVVDPLDRIGDTVLPGFPAFTQDEIRVVDDWVSAGGALLLVAEQAPFGRSAAGLASALRVTMSNGVTTDPAHEDSVSANPGCLLFSRDNGLLADHAITRGRDSLEIVRRVATWTGQSLDGPPGAVRLLALSKDAHDVGIGDSVVARGSAAGLAFMRGHGRVVVLGDAAMLTAQLNVTPSPDRPPGVPLEMGINRTDLDNRQFTLNVLHWLSGVLDPPPPPLGPRRTPPMPHAGAPRAPRPKR